MGFNEIGFLAKRIITWINAFMSIVFLKQCHFIVGGIL